MRAAVLWLALLLGGLASESSSNAAWNATDDARGGDGALQSAVRAALPPRRCAPRDDDPRRGRCAFVDTVAVLLPPRGAATPTLASPLLVTNFGIVAQVPGAPDAPARYAVVCDEVLGATPTEFVTMDAVGSVVFPTATGLRLADAEGARRCGYRWAPAPLLDRPVISAGADPNDARRLWALTGRQSRELYRSDDGGASWTQVMVSPAGVALWNIAVAPSDSRVVYLAGYSQTAALVIVVTRDGGASFETIEPAAGFADSRWVVFLGASPEDPQTVFMVRAAASDGGDELWRSTDGGRTASLVLELPVGHTHAGFTFGDAPGLVYAAGRPTLRTDAAPSAVLYVSRDGGMTWQGPIPSAADGPRYRCLAARDGKLYACAGGNDAGDRFLLGRSDDDGRTWHAVITTADIEGPVACGTATCASTSSWLCESYGICGGADAGAPDAGPDALPAAGERDRGGCDCSVASARERAASSTWALGPTMMVVAMLVRRRPRRRPQ